MARLATWPRPTHFSRNHSLPNLKSIHLQVHNRDKVWVVYFLVSLSSRPIALTMPAVHGNPAHRHSQAVEGKQ